MTGVVLAALLALPPHAEPTAVAVGRDGSIFVADALSARISAFDRSGTPLGQWGGLDRPGGIAVAPDGRVYVSDTGSHSIQVFSSDGRLLHAWGRLGSDAGEFNEPLGIAVGADRVAVADARNNRIQIFDRDGAFQSYLWSYGYLNGAFDRPVDVAFDDGGDLYVSDQGNCRIQKFDPSGRFLSAWGGFGSQGALLAEPGGIDFRDGHLIVADTHNHRVVTFDSSGKLLQERRIASLDEPSDVAALPGGDALIACGAIEGRCRIVGGRDEPPPAAPPAPRYGHAVGGAGNLLLVAERETGSLLMLDLASERPAVRGALVHRGREPLQFVRPAGVAYDPGTNRMIVSDSGNGRFQVLRWDALDVTRTRFVKGLFLLDKEEIDRFPGGWDLRPSNAVPEAIAESAKGDLFVVDSLFGRVLVLNRSLELLGSWGGYGDQDGRFRNPVGIAFGRRAGIVYVVDAGSRRVQAFDEHGAFRFGWRGDFADPRAIAAGKDGVVYVVDRGASQVKKFDERGRQLGTWGGETLDKPDAVFVDARNRVIVIDSGHDRAVAFSKDGAFLWELPLAPAFQR